MKIVVAMDSFKESLTAPQACDIVAEVIAASRPDTETVIKPMADGGEGTAQAMIAACDGKWIPEKVMGPLPEMQVDAGFAWFDRHKTALVEMAAASGLELLTPAQRNPMLTTTYGTGQLIAAAVEYGAKQVYLAVGGSATVDGGTGAACALGWKFVDSGGRDFIPAGGNLKQIDRMVPPAAQLRTRVEVLCDVNNPLCGKSGAARVYAPQKGADGKAVEKLEEGLSHLADIVATQLNRNINDVPGAGAAGGLAAGTIAFMDATLVSGIDVIMSESHIDEALADADWLVTGEGRFDRQSLSGKVVSGLAARAAKSNARVAVLAGQVLMGEIACKDNGITCAFTCMEEGMTLQYAIDNAAHLLEEATKRFAAKYL